MRVDEKVRNLRRAREHEKMKMKIKKQKEQPADTGLLPNSRLGLQLYRKQDCEASPSVVPMDGRRIRSSAACIAGRAFKSITSECVARE